MKSETGCAKRIPFFKEEDMANYRRGRIHDEALKVLADAFRKIKDPRVNRAFVSVTDVDVTPDLKYAKVYYSVLTGDEKEVRQGLEKAKGFVRHELAQQLNLRITPELTFVPDHSGEYGAHIASVLNGLHISDEETPEQEEEQ